MDGDLIKRNPVIHGINIVCEEGTDARNILNEEKGGKLLQFSAKHHAKYE